AGRSATAGLVVPSVERPRPAWSRARGRRHRVTSHEVLEDGLRVTRAHRLHSGGWMVLSARESDESEPVWVHYGNVLEADPSARPVPPLRKGEYAMRSPEGEEWHVFGPV